MNDNYEPSIVELMKDEAPHIPAGIYDMKIVTWETRVMFGKCKKLDITFQVIDGEYAGVKIHYYCNVKRFRGKPRKKGEFQLGKKSKFARQFYGIMEAANDKGDIRLDRIPLTRLKHVTAKIRSVKDASNKPIPKQLQYSVVGDFISTKQDNYN